jgi:hypothetical protein
VAELQPISKNLMVNMELSMTLMGHRMAHHFEQKRRQIQKINHNDMRHHPRLVGSFTREQLFC